MTISYVKGFWNYAGRKVVHLALAEPIYRKYTHGRTMPIGLHILQNYNFKCCLSLSLISKSMRTGLIRSMHWNDKETRFLKLIPLQCKYCTYSHYHKPCFVYFLHHFLRLILQAIYVHTKQGNASLKSAVYNQEQFQINSGL